VEDVEDVEDVELVTVATNRNRWLEDWIESAKKQGFNPVVLGEGIRWNGFRTKTSLVIDYVRKLRESKLVCVTDSFDVVVVAPQAELLAKYRSMGAPIVIGAEAQCSLNCEPKAPKQCRIQGSMRFPNGGFVMGPAKYLDDLYTFVLKHSPNDDQVGIGQYMMQAACKNFKLDQAQALVANVYKRSRLQFDERLGRFRHKKTKQYPCIIHMPNMHYDLGKRSNLVRGKTLTNFQKVSKWKHFRALFKHISNNMNNPVYLRVWLPSLIAIIVLSFIPLFCYLKTKHKKLNIKN